MGKSEARRLAKESINEVTTLNSSKCYKTLSTSTHTTKKAITPRKTQRSK
jgi:hypothetical protein